MSLSNTAFQPFADFLTNETITADGSVGITTDFGSCKEITVVVSIIGPVTGGSPTLQFTLWNQDSAGNIFEPAMSGLYTGTIIPSIFLFTIKSGRLQLNWEVTGTTPSFAGVSVSAVGSSIFTTQPVSATSFPLPTGAATEVKQTQPGVDIGDVTVNNTSGASAVNIQDGGNSITVDGSVTANAGTNLNTSLLALDSTLTNNNQKSQTIDGSGNVWGPRTLSGGVNWMPVINLEAASNGAAVAARTLQIGGSDGTNLRNISVDTAGRLNINTILGTVAVTQSTSPWVVNTTQLGGTAIDTNSGNKSAGTQRIVIATDQPQLTNALKVDGSAVTQPVSGTVTANAGTNLNTSALALDATLTNATQKTKIVDTAGTNVASVSAAGAVKVDGSAVTQPVSGTVTANAGTNLNTSALLLDATFTGRINTQGQKTMAASTPVVLASDQSALPVSVNFSTSTCYSVGVGPFTPPATPTDTTTITGSATKTIRVLSFIFTPTQTTRSMAAWFMVKRSTANSAGTSTTPTIVPLDSNNAAATAVVRQYTANPTLGTSIGNAMIVKVLSDDGGATSVGGGGYTFDFTANGKSSGIVLRGTAQVLALNFNGAALPVGLSLTGTWTWIEE